MQPRGSISRRLVLAVALPLLLAFLATGFIVDYLVASLSDQAQADRIEQQMLALVALTRLDDAGKVDSTPLAGLSRAADAGSGRYLMVLGTAGQVLWRSPSLAGAPLASGDPVAAGQRSFEYCHVPGMGAAALLSLGLRLADGTGQDFDLTLVAGEDRAGLIQRRHVLRGEMVGWFGGLTLLVLALVAWITRRELAPVRQLEREVGEIGEGGREQFGVDYPAELHGLAGALNALVHRENQRITRYRDTLGNLAHSLKTPLAVMRASLEGESPRVRAILDGEIERITRLVDHQLRRAATGGSAMRRRAVPLAPILADLRATLLRVHSAKDLTITVTVQPGASFMGDPGDLTELLGNLLDNACKWSRLRLSVEARLEGGQPPERALRIDVCDDGPGIPPADRQRVLGRGVRGDEQAPGHGLGLSMVAETVALYGGELAIGDCETLGGARVSIGLPGRVADAPA